MPVSSSDTKTRFCFDKIVVLCAGEAIHLPGAGPKDSLRQIDADGLRRCNLMPRFVLYTIGPRRRIPMS